MSIRKYAGVNNEIIVAIIDEDEDNYCTLNKTYNLVIDITDMSPSPAIGWVLNGNKLEYPQNQSDLEKLEYELADKKTTFGINLARTAIVKIGVRNKILLKTGPQVAVIVTNLLPIKLLLDTGALGTARYSCVQLKSVYTEYADIFDQVINEINIFESTFGL